MPARMPTFIKLHLPDFYIKRLDELVARGHYPNRAEAIRMAVRDLLIDELRSFPKR